MRIYSRWSWFGGWLDIVWKAKCSLNVILRMPVLWFENLHPGFIQVPQGILHTVDWFYLAGHPRKQYQAFKRIGQPSSTAHLERNFACRNSAWEKAVDNMSLPRWITHISYASESNDFVRTSWFLSFVYRYTDAVYRWYTLFSMSLCSVLGDQVLVFLFSYWIERPSCWEQYPWWTQTWSRTAGTAVQL